MNNVVKASKTSRKPFRLDNKKREWLSGYLFILPWVIGVCIFTLWPIIQAFYYSFCEAVFRGNSIVATFTWFENFKYAFATDTKFPTMIREYLLEIVVQVPFSLTFALLISMILNQNIKLRGMWRVIYFLPAIIISGPVVSELMSQGSTTISVASDNIGSAIVSIIPEFFGKLITILFDKLILVLWYTGIPILIFLAGLQRLNKQIYEAAAIDGASKWQSFWKITLPSMSSFILVNAVYMIVTLSNSSLIQEAASSEATSTMSIAQYIATQYTSATGRGYGYACCLGIIYLGIILLHIGLYALIFVPKKPRIKKGGR
ncbi:MAG: sugar ABC transporter permease [Bacilli bacterium]|nr:sugar ABC transporter permease [Bacilli bacterium]